MYLSIIDSLIAHGRYSFTLSEMCQKVGRSPHAVKVALYRLVKKGELALPYREFYLIIPPEYRSRGCLPPQQFIPDLMTHLKEDYYVGLLTAAEYHGAAHHRPQVFQVVVPRPRRPINCGKMRVEFATRKNTSLVPTETRNTPAGVVKISSPEATALDLVGYMRHCGGLDNVAMVLAELAEKIDIHRLVEIAGYSPLSWVQRLGFLLDLLQVEEKADALSDYLQQKNPVLVRLLPGDSIVGSQRRNRWSVIVNAEVELDS